MNRRWRKIMVAVCLGGIFVTLDGRTTEVEALVEEINTLRENLAHGVTDNADADTFAAVCKPVGARAKSVAQEKQWRFRQVSNRYRNPANKPTPAEAKAIRRFEEDSALQRFWNDEENGATYYRRITVQTTCLACHGDKEARPDFIKTKYPNDLAHGFKAGELRGIFVVVAGAPKTRQDMP